MVVVSLGTHATLLTVPQEPMQQECGFDGVCVCTGTNTWASLPCFKGQERFQGEIMHSEKYRCAEVRTQHPRKACLGTKRCILRLMA